MKTFSTFKRVSATSLLLLVLVLGLQAAMTPSQALWPFNKKDDEASQEVKEEDLTSAEKLKQEQGKLSDKDKEAASKRVKDEAQKKEAEAAQQAAQQHQAQKRAPKVQIESPVSDEVHSLEVERPIQSEDYVDKNDYVAVDDPNNPLGITTAAKRLDQTADMIDRKQYTQAIQQLNELKSWLVDATEVHITLYKTLKDVTNAQVQSEMEKQLALQFAVLRDKAFFQLGMAHLGQSDYPTAIKSLSKVIQSQPRSEMGVKAYEVLQQIGFTEKVKLRERASAPAANKAPEADSTP